MHPELNIQAATDRHRQLVEVVPVQAEEAVPDGLVDEVLARFEDDEDERRAA